jgi:metallophosphoesterase superfamily enzyme
VAVGGLAPVSGLPILELTSTSGARPTLILADLHLGLVAADDPLRTPIEISARRMVEEILEAAHARRARTILVAGDAKHPIVGTPRPLRPVIFDFFSTLLADGLAVEVVLGNHDVGLVRFLPREVEVHPATGVVRDGVGVFHGHRWPSNRVLRARRLVAGHLHPGFRFAPSTENPSAKRRCWVRVRLVPETPSRRRRRHVPLRATELVVLPAFHPLAGVESLNRQRPARGRTFLFNRFLSRGESRAYLLDGTDLGPVPTPGSPAPRRAASAPASPAR